MSALDPQSIQHQRRLGIALLLSLLLHAVLLFLPTLGGTTRFARPEQAGARTIPAVLAATLAPEALVRATPPALIQPESPEQHHDVEVRSKKVAGNDRMTSTEHKTLGADVLPTPAVVYYPTGMLTLRPQPIGETDLDPPSIRPIVASGKVVLTVWVGPLGTVSRVQPEASDLPGNFVAAAVAGFERQRFIPGELYGRTVGAVMKIEITYTDGRLRSTDIAP